MNCMKSPTTISEVVVSRSKSTSATTTMINKKKAVVVAMAAPKFRGSRMREKVLSELIEAKVAEAKRVCQGTNRSSDECKVAWDEVEEISQAKADFRLRLQTRDPLEFFCLDNPDSDQCLLYDT